MTASSLTAQDERLLTRPFVLVLCVQFLFGLSYSTFFLLPKYLSREFQASASVIGAVAATALIAGVLASPITGTLLDRGARRPFITYGALANGLCGGGFALVHAVSVPLYVLRAVHGISYALVFNAIVTLAADLSPSKKLGQAIGLTGAAGTVANALAPALAELVADARGWPLVFLLAGGCCPLRSVSLALRPRRLRRRSRLRLSRCPAPSR